MSKTLLECPGLIEVPDTVKRESNYKSTNVHFGSFSGGTQRGHSLQISFDEHHVQLSNEQVMKLKEVLNTYY